MVAIVVLRFRDVPVIHSFHKSDKASLEEHSISPLCFIFIGSSFNHGGILPQLQVLFSIFMQKIILAFIKDILYLGYYHFEGISEDDTIVM